MVYYFASKQATIKKKKKKKNWSMISSDIFKPEKEEISLGGELVVDASDGDVVRSDDAGWIDRIGHVR